MPPIDLRQLLQDVNDQARRLVHDTGADLVQSSANLQSVDFATTPKRFIRQC